MSRKSVEGEIFRVTLQLSWLRREMKRVEWTVEWCGVKGSGGS